MELRQLKHAVTLAQTKNFGKAAELSFITQSALSRSIQSLEEDLGVKLFDRSKREVHLTAYGEVFLKRAQPLVSQSVKLKRELQLLQNLDAGELIIGCGPYVSAIYMAPLISKLLVMKPNIRVKVVTDNWGNLAQQLREDKIDMFVSDVREVDLKHDLHLDLMREYPAIACCRKGHPLSEKDACSFKDLRAYPMVSTRMPEVVHKQLEGLDFALQTDNTYLLKDIVQRSDAVFCGMQPLIYQELEAGTLAVLNFEDWPDVRVCCGIVSPKGRTPSPIVSMVIEALRELDESFWQQAQAGLS